MILSKDDVNVGKVRGGVTEELPEAEAPSPWIVLGVLGHPLWLQVTSQGKMAALVSAPLQTRSQDNHGALYLQPFPSTNHI